MKINWTITDSYIIGKTNDIILQNKKVASFDLDDTLVKTNSGNVSSDDENDWSIYNDNVVNKLNGLKDKEYHLVIVSNQSGISKGKVDINVWKKKIENIINHIKLDFTIICALKDDMYRKPKTKLWDEFVDGDCLIVSSAPSAESYMDYIRAYQDGLYIIAVDSAVPMLQKNGVNPDFVISIDPQGRIHEHFLGVNYSFIPIFSLVSPPSIVAQYKGMLSLNSHPLSQIIESLFPSVVGSIDSGTGSVAGDSLRFARLCGFKNIGMIGFDFCFNDNLIYSRGTAYQDRYSLMFNNRFLSPESFNGSYIFRGTSTLIEESKYTRRNFLNYRDGLSRIIRGLDSSIVFINDIGLRVDGALYKSFEDFISLCSLKRKGNNLRERLFYRRKRLIEILDLQYLLKFLMREDLARELSIESYGRNNFDINIKRLTKVLHSINLST